MSYIKYYVYKKQQQVNGQWVDVYPAETKPDGYPLGTYDTLAECEGTEPQYRWVNLNPAVDYYCNGTTKYYKQQKQISTDGGQTWSNVVPAEYQQGSVAEFESSDCGYVPPTPTGSTKFRATYSDTPSVYELECNDNPTLSDADTKPTGYTASAMTSAVIGDCVTALGSFTFRSCYSLTSATVPNSVTSIGRYAFDLCSGLTRFNSDVDGVCNIPTGITAISDDCFGACYGFETINIPTGVTSIGEGAFDNCRYLTSINIPTGITAISDRTFAFCYRLPSITIPSGVTSIGDWAFQVCNSLKRLNSSVDGVFNIPTGVTSIGVGAFHNCLSLTSTTIPSGVTIISEDAFSSSNNLISITIPDTVTVIDNQAFEFCKSLTGITIPNSVTTIGLLAFNWDDKIKTIVIGSGITSIGWNAFCNNTGATSITCLATTPPTLAQAPSSYGSHYPFDNTGNAPIYVPSQSVNSYKSSWSMYSDRIVALL